MNAPVAPFALDAAALRAARAEARRTGRSALEVLEEHAGLPPREFVEQLGRLLHYPTLTHAQLAALVPDYEVLPFAEAVRHDVIAARDAAGALAVVCADPLDADRIEWAEARIRAPFT